MGRFLKITLIAVPILVGILVVSWQHTVKPRVRSKIPIFEGIVINDVRTIELQPWPQLGETIRGLYLKFSDYQMTDGRILELPPHGSAKSQRHFFEMGVYLFGGPGHTIIQHEDGESQRIDWDYKTLFSIPLNVRYQHFNDSDQPVRMLAISSFPFLMNAIDNERFLFDNEFEMRDRFDPGQDFQNTVKHILPNRAVRNVVPDAVEHETVQQKHRRNGATGMSWQMAGNTMLSLRVSEMAPEMYKTAHRHSSEAFILFVSGKGYSVTWSEGRYAQRYRVDWSEGTLFVPPIYWYHQHLNPGSVPARFVAVNTPRLMRNLGLRFIDQMKTDLPDIEAEWKRELQKNATGKK
jgi:gentisate 1,2-dioxygenase